jgi:hypothetical protein
MVRLKGKLKKKFNDHIATRIRDLSACSTSTIYATVTEESLSNDLYGCETWSLTLREEHRLKVFKNRVQRRIFG